MDGIASILDKYIELSFFGAVIVVPIALSMNSPLSRSSRPARVQRSAVHRPTFLDWLQDSLAHPTASWMGIAAAFAICICVGHFARGASYAVLNTTHIAVISSAEWTMEHFGDSDRVPTVAPLKRQLCDYSLPILGALTSYESLLKGCVPAGFAEGPAAHSPDSFAIWTYIHHLKANTWYLEHPNSFESILEPLSKAITVATAFMLAGVVTSILSVCTALRDRAPLRLGWLPLTLLLYVGAFETYWSQETRFHLEQLAAQMHFDSDRNK